MDKTAALAALAALAQPTRLAAFRALIATYPGTLPAGDVARRCKVPHNTMSTHLSTLVRARLISADRQGRTVNYRANLDDFRALIAFLTRDCCGGRAEICAPVLAPLAHACGTSQRESAHA